MKHKDDDYWDAILNEIDMDFIPLEYINTVVVKFRDGKVWEIDVEKSNQEVKDVEASLDDFFKEYDKQIDTVDFRLDTGKLKRDIGNRTRRFLKVNK